MGDHIINIDIRLGQSLRDNRYVDNADLQSETSNESDISRSR